MWDKRRHTAWLPNLKIPKHIHRLVTVKSNIVWIRSGRVTSQYWPIIGRKRALTLCCLGFLSCTSKSLAFLFGFGFPETNGQAIPSCQLWRWEGYMHMSYLIQLFIPAWWNAGMTPFFCRLFRSAAFVVCRDLAVRLWVFCAAGDLNILSGSVGMECLWVRLISYFSQVSLVGSVSCWPVYCNMSWFWFVKCVSLNQEIMQKIQKDRLVRKIMIYGV